MKHRIIIPLIIYLSFLVTIASGQKQGSSSMFIDTTSSFGYDWKSINIGFPNDYIADSLTIPS